MRTMRNLCMLAVVGHIVACTDSGPTIPNADGHYAYQGNGKVTLVTVKHGQRTTVVEGDIEGRITGATRFKPEECPAFLYVPDASAIGSGMIVPARPAAKWPSCPITETMTNRAWIFLPAG